ncbi:MAG: glycosyltransferase family 9 protein, partial [Candidatus Adiutrix sp.]
KPYVVIHCLSNDLNKDWHKDGWLTLAAFFASYGLYILEVGLKPLLSEEAGPFYRDMTHLRDLPQIARLIEGAQFFLGVDSGMAHMSNALGKNGLVIMGCYGPWNEHIPFSGLYNQGHIVRHWELPARYLKAETVLAATKAKLAGDMESLSDHLGQPKPMKVPNFPNPKQRLILKLCRPAIKFLALGHEYNQFKANPRFFFIAQGSAPKLVAFLRRVLGFFGPIPPMVIDDI